MTSFLRTVTVIGVTALLASCTTPRETTTVTRPANAELASLHKKTATHVGSRSETATAGKRAGDNALVAKYADKLDVEKSSLDNPALLRFIDEWYGVPYKYGGKSKSGVDCSSFTCTLYSNVYNNKLAGTSAELYQRCKKIKRADLRQGDLMFFKIHRGRVSHVGVYVANDYFVHASTKAGVVLSNLNESYYKQRFAGGGRLKD